MAARSALSRTVGPLRGVALAGRHFSSRNGKIGFPAKVFLPPCPRLKRRHGLGAQYAIDNLYQLTRLNHLTR